MIAARVWKFGDNVSTDLMLPGPALILSPEEQTSWVFQANRPGWVDEASLGDFIVGGRGVGMGSSRPGARSLRNLGVGCVLAESIARLFFRNCVNFGLLAVECAGISAAFEKGRLRSFQPRTGRCGTARPARCWPAHRFPTCC